MFRTINSTLRRIFLVSYKPDPSLTSHLDRAVRQSNDAADVLAAVPDARECERLFGVPVTRRGIQPIYLEITNRSDSPLRLRIVGIDPEYFTPLEAAALNHFSILKRLSAYGLLGWLFFHLILLTLPSKLFTAFLANGDMDELFQEQAFRLRPIPPGETVRGYVFTRFEAGTKVFHVSLFTTSRHHVLEPNNSPEQLPAVAPHVDFVFSIPVPGIAADYLRRDFTSLLAGQTIQDCTVPELTTRLQAMPQTTTNRKATGTGDPVNLVVIAEFDVIVASFVGRWDETETITLASCWRTAKAFLFGSDYRYSPVSPLYLFGRSQDVALQRIRQSINERLHLRLWLSPLRFQGRPVWVGQISRDIGVRFTTKTWNLTTHRVDPDVDEARDYVVEDLLEAERVEAAAYVPGVGACDVGHPRHNLTGDPYHTDGKRAVILLAPERTPPRFLDWN